MKFDPKAPPFWERTGGPITERMLAYERAATAERRRRDELLREITELKTRRGEHTRQKRGTGQQKSISTAATLMEHIEELESRLALVTNE